MIEFSWSLEKNILLKADAGRGACFEDVVAAIQNGGLLDDIAHPNRDKYPHQRILVVRLMHYVYAVPYVMREDGSRFLKTVYPSRALGRIYLAGDADDEE